MITDLRNEIRVDATPDEAWAVVGDLAAADRWVPGVVSARVDGGTRVCTLADVVWDATVEVGDPGLATMLETGFREAMQSLAAQLQA